MCECWWGFYFGGNPQEDLSASFCWQQQIYKCLYRIFVTCLVKSEIFLTLWTLNPGTSSLCITVRIHTIRAFIKNGSAVYLLIVYSHFVIFNLHAVTSNNHSFLFSSETWDADAALSSIPLSVLVMIFASFSDGFKHCWNVWCISACLYLITSLFGIIYSAFALIRPNTERAFFFCYFRLNNFGCQTFGASLVVILPVNFQNSAVCDLRMKINGMST